MDIVLIADGGNPAPRAVRGDEPERKTAAGAISRRPVRIVSYSLL